MFPFKNFLFLSFLLQPLPFLASLSILLNFLYCSPYNPFWGSPIPHLKKGGSDETMLEGDIVFMISYIKLISFQQHLSTLYHMTSYRSGGVIQDAFKIGNRFWVHVNRSPNFDKVIKIKSFKVTSATKQ